MVLEKSDINQVMRRRVHYFSGFDPRGAAYYHRLCEEEASKPQVQGGILSVTRRRRMGKLFSQWVVCWNPPANSRCVPVETEHVFMSWDDIIRSNWSKRPLTLIKEFFQAYRGIIFDVDLSRVKQIFKGVYITGVLPGVYVLGSLVIVVLVALGLSQASALVLDGAGLQGFWNFSSWVLVWFVAGALGGALGMYGERRGLFWLLRIFTYVIRMGRTGVADAEQRTSHWVASVIQRQQDDPVDEVLLVGHSIGALMMVSTIDALLQDPRWQALQQGQKTKVLTMGQCYPFIAMVPRPKAELFRQALKRLSFDQQLLWWDVTAKIDPLCFYRSHPLVKTGEDYSNSLMPISHLASFFKMYTPQSWAVIRQQKLDAHFLYLRAPEIAGNFNLLDVLYGPKLFELHVRATHD